MSFDLDRRIGIEVADDDTKHIAGAAVEAFEVGRELDAGKSRVAARRRRPKDTILPEVAEVRAAIGRSDTGKPVRPDRHVTDAVLARVGDAEGNGRGAVTV